MNPFKYGRVVEGSDFCGRTEHVAQINEYIDSCQSIVLTGERRIGKTSLVCEAVRKSKAKSIYVSLYGTKSVNTLCRKFLRGIVDTEKKQVWYLYILHLLSHLRPVIATDPVTNLPTIQIDASTEIKESSIPEVFALIKTVKKRIGKSRLVVIIDEFQDILELKNSREILATMRDIIQFQKNIAYIFVGSIKHQMVDIFSSPSSPFFKTAIPIEIEPIPYQEFSRFLRKKFGNGKISIGKDDMKYIFSVANDIPGDVQQFCEAVWSVMPSGEAVTKERLMEALLLIFARERNTYEAYIRIINDLQLKLLKTIARRGGKNVLSTAFMKAAGQSNASVVKLAVEKLLSLEILFKVGDEYKYINPFFRAWILSEDL